MLRLTNVSMPLSYTQDALVAAAAKLLGIAPARIQTCEVYRKSVDARKKEDVHFVLTLDVAVDAGEDALAARCKGAQVITPAVPAVWPGPMMKSPAHRPVVVGSGPAGLFAALTLAHAGLDPILVERGKAAPLRKRDVEAFWQSGQLDPTSNVQFGEGGAGTFSDGKLNTGIKDPRCRKVLETFVACGAPESILTDSKPHIGTDYLVRVVQAIRAQIIKLGGEVRFETQLTGVKVEKGRLVGAALQAQTIDTRAMIVAIGHSARDTFAMLHEAGLKMEGKPFSIGARVEHHQAMIDQAQYGRFAGHPALGAADYKLSAHLPNGRGVYTFCMCPGGSVVAAASEPGGVVTNGMSLHARQEANANSAVLVDVRPGDLHSDDPLAGIWFQQKWERQAFLAGGGSFAAPAQRMEDFLKGAASKRIGDVQPSYLPGVVPGDLRFCLPAFIIESMEQGLRAFDQKLRGFAHPDALLTGVETRSSSPVRILRDEKGQASIAGIFPAGEGAGYAGGIMSAAVDGMRSAEKLLDFIQMEAN